MYYVFIYVLCHNLILYTLDFPDQTLWKVVLCRYVNVNDSGPARTRTNNMVFHAIKKLKSGANVNHALALQ